MDMDLPIELQLDDGPERRWSRAVGLVECNQSPGQYDDAETIAAWKLCHRLRGEGRFAGTDSWYIQAINGAHKLFVTDDPVRWEVEGWLLTGLSPDAVLAKMQIPAPLVQWFHDVFFDVADRLNNQIWIGRHILLVGQQTSNVSERQIWREAATAGLAMLELLLDDYHGRLANNPGDRQMAERFRTQVQISHVPLDDKLLVRELIQKNIAFLQERAPHMNPIACRQAMDASLRLAAMAGITDLIEPPPPATGGLPSGFAGSGMLTMPPGFRPLLGPLAYPADGAAEGSPKRPRRRSRAPKREPEAPVCPASGEFRKCVTSKQ